MNENRTLGRRREVPRSIAPTSPDPFSCIAVDGDRLAVLLRSSSARQAGHPIFSVNDAIEFQGLRRVFEVGFEDAPLTSAVYLVLMFTADGMTEECYRCRLHVIQTVKERLPIVREAATCATIGAILLLIGVEVSSDSIDELR